MENTPSKSIPWIFKGIERRINRPIEHSIIPPPWIMANIVGLSSLRGNAPGSGSGSDGDDDATRNQYYAGGASGRGGGSGLSVIGPDGDGNGGSDSMANIIGRAQRDTQAAQPSAGAARHVITFYRAGFSVNDGPYRARDDPANRPFLDALERGCVHVEVGVRN
jgi:hypothetical protein